MAPEAKHSKLGPSGSTRWINCPGSVALGETMPQPPSSVYAEEGTAAHMLCEKCLHTGKHADAFQGMTITTDEGSEFVVDDEMAEAVQVFVDEVNRVKDEIGTNAEVHIEVQFHLTDYHKDIYGTSDASVCQPLGTLYVLDYKHGKGVAVAAKGNTQMRCYALGAAQKHPWMYENVEMIIVQPRAPHADGPIRREVMSYEDLEAWGRGILVPAAVATEAKDAPFKCGDWCKWCKASAVCPAQRKWALESAQSAFSEDKFIPYGKQTFENPKGLTPDELGLIMQYIPQLAEWCKTVKEYITGQLIHGKPITGYKLVNGRKSRKWTDEKVTESFYAKSLGEELFKKTMRTPKQVEDLLKRANKGKAKTDARTIALKQLDKMVTSSHPKVLAPANDKRQQVTGQSAKEVFADDPLA